MFESPEMQSALVGALSSGLHHLLKTENEIGSSYRVEYVFPTKDHGETKTPMELSATESEDYNLECKAYSHLTQALSKEIFHQFETHLTTYALWNALESGNEGTAEYRKTKGKVLKKEWKNFSIQPDESLKDAVARYLHLLTELKRVDIVFPTKNLVQCFSEGLPIKWDPMIVEI
ncbi:uncharacterized protein [Rutidosis leptorrhynchoides]|uniref:uncharacterized protein n=1 Tax=Rutidosis leptorrhynchoides TaxID=125765 RepID=UPI003A98FF80